MFLFFFFFNDPSTTYIYTLSLHDALPISQRDSLSFAGCAECRAKIAGVTVDSGPRSAADIAWCSLFRRSEEHTSELQSHHDLVCRLLLEKKKKNKNNKIRYNIS